MSWQEGLSTTQIPQTPGRHRQQSPSAHADSQGHPDRPLSRHDGRHLPPEHGDQEQQGAG